MSRFRKNLKEFAVCAAGAAMIVSLAACAGQAASVNWYAAGKAFAVADDKQSALLIGPVSGLAKVCTTDLTAASPGVPGQRPSATDATAAGQWVEGCEAGYHQDNPNQVISGGIMYGNGAVPCTESCSSRWYAAGESIAIAALGSPGFSPGSSGAASSWCASLMFPSQPLPAGIAAQLKANMPPPGPAVAEWAKGCEAGYSTAGETPTGTVPSATTTPTEAVAPVETQSSTQAPTPSATTPTAVSTMSSADYQGFYQEAYDETAADYNSGQTPAVYNESNSDFCTTTVEPGLPWMADETAFYAGCMAALKALE